jgi:hypothetical protein
VTICHCKWCQRRTGTALGLRSYFRIIKCSSQGGNKSVSPRLRRVRTMARYWVLQQVRQ